jgi:hypothetical protein
MVENGKYKKLKIKITEEYLKEESKESKVFKKKQNKIMCFNTLFFS